MVNNEIIYQIKQHTADFILSQIVDILKIDNKGLGRMKKTFVPALISQQFCLVNKNISKTPISLNKQFRASANHYDQHYNVDLSLMTISPNYSLSKDLSFTTA